MLDLVFAVMLAGATPNDPGLGSPGLDSRGSAWQQVAEGRGGRGDGPPPVRRPVQQEEEQSLVEAVITEAERRIFRDYFGSRPNAGRTKMPPGIEKQLVRNRTLPQGVVRRGLPRDLARALPARLKNYEFVLVEDRVLLVDRATDMILDAMDIDGD